MNKFLARFNKKLLPSGVSHRDGDCKLASFLSGVANNCNTDKKASSRNEFSIICS